MRTRLWLAVGFVLGGVVLIVLVLPGAPRIGGPSRQSEARSNLKRLHQLQRIRLEERASFTELYEELGYGFERKNRYLYVLGDTSDLLVPGLEDGGLHRGLHADIEANRPTPDNAALYRAIPVALLREVGVHGTCPEDCSFTALAIGNIDDDPTVDLWSISTRDRTIEGTVVPAGIPFNHVNDMRDGYVLPP